MGITHSLLFLVFMMVASANVTAAKVAEDFPIGYVLRTDEPYYSPQRYYAGMELQAPSRALEGVRLALKESRVLSRSLGINFSLNEIVITDSTDVLDSINKAITNGTVFLILDLPLSETKTIVEHFAQQPIVFFNTRHQSDQLRKAECDSQLFHTTPSDAMLNDALAQYLKKKRWERVLVLYGPELRDEEVARSFVHSAKKVGLKIVDEKQFVLSNDPRLREQNNIALLTSGKTQDVVFVADEVGEFSRYIPYQTQEPALVVGSQGLMSSAWHWSWERHGAPQLNQRFDKLSDKNMSDSEYAGWAAVRSVISAVVKTRSSQFEDVFNYLSDTTNTLDLYKGYPGSFRPWSRQLRQPILLHTYNAVISTAPVEGFMHHSNDLDTLGVDLQESDCS